MQQRRFKSSLAFALLFIGGALVAVLSPAHAAQLQDRSIGLSSSVGSATNVIYTTRFTFTSSYMLGSIAIEFCVEDPLPNQPCTTPPGLDMSSAIMIAQNGQVGFSIHPNTTINRVVLSRTPAMTAPGVSDYQIGGVRNPDVANRTFYGRIYTYASTDGTGVNVDDGGVALSLANQVAINTEVPPYLLFCLGEDITGFDCLTANGNFLDFGEFSKTNVKSVKSQMVIATNAGFGAGITMSGITLTSGNNVIPNLVAPTAPAPGSSQFGINLRANSFPGAGQDPAGPGSMAPTANYNIPNRYTFNNGDVIAASSGTSDVKKFTATYIANVSNAQPPGVYNTTLTYIALANF